MNEIVSLSISIILGTVLGILYGLFYLYNKKRVLDALHTAPSRKNSAIIYLGSFARIGFIALLIGLLLRYPTIPFILTISCFLIGFWLVILFKKVV